MSKMKWRGDDEIRRNMRRYGDDVRDAVKAIADNYAPILEAEAKRNAPWEDRTTNARQGLFATVEQEKGRTTIYLSHQMDYGVYLELGFHGRYSIIMPTLERYYNPIRNSIRELLR